MAALGHAMELANTKQNDIHTPYAIKKSFFLLDYSARDGYCVHINNQRRQMIDQGILIETYCKTKSKEEIIADLKLKRMRPKQREVLFTTILRSLNDDQLNAVLNMADKETLVEYLKGESSVVKQGDGMPVLPKDLKRPERFTVDREELALVLTDEIPDWFRAAVRRVVGNSTMPQIWRSRYGYLLKLFNDNKREHLRLFKEIEPEYRQAVESAKAALSKETTATDEQAQAEGTTSQP